MNKTITSVEAGKQDAEQLIKDERIDYEPFIAISDMDLVRRTVPVSFAALEKTLAVADPELSAVIKARAEEWAEELGSSFSYDHYAAGIAAGVAAVWEKIRGQVL